MSSVKIELISSDKKHSLYTTYEYTAEQEMKQFLWEHFVARTA
jgi:hypothetical protein